MGLESKRVEQTIITPIAATQELMRGEIGNVEVAPIVCFRPVVTSQPAITQEPIIQIMSNVEVVLGSEEVPPTTPLETIMKDAISATQEHEMVSIRVEEAIVYEIVG